MTKVEINGRTYCVETLIHERERLIQEVKASAELHRLVLDDIKAEIERIADTYPKQENDLVYDAVTIDQGIEEDINYGIGQGLKRAIEVIDRHIGERSRTNDTGQRGW